VEWREYLHDAPYSKSCAALPMPAEISQATAKGNLPPSLTLKGKTAAFTLHILEGATPGDPLLRSLAEHGSDLALNGQIREALATFWQLAGLVGYKETTVSSRQ
jgi:hypothetical protein